MLRFNPFNVDKRVNALHELNRMMKPFYNGPQLYDERDMTTTLQPIWNFIGAIQGYDFRDVYGNTVLTYVDTERNYKDDIMDSLKGLPKGPFFGKYVENDPNIPDVREYSYILGFLLATVDQPSDDPNYDTFVGRKFIGRYKCVFGSIAIPGTTTTWYDVLKTIFTFINRYPQHFGLTDGWGSKENQSITFNADPYPDFMSFPDDEVDHTVCKEIKKKDPKNRNDNQNHLKDNLLKEKQKKWTTTNILLLVFIGTVLLFLLFNPVTFSLTNKLFSTFTKDTPTNGGIILHGFIFVLLFLIILFIFRNKSTI